ncbi:MAG: ParB/RepB/Spo0J family partition protein [Patescibacteria group bacterium]
MAEFGEPRRSSSIFFIELDRIKPNSMQPRTEFDEGRLSELAESIRQYGVLQPLVVLRQEKATPTGVVSEYELIAGERRLRAARLAGLREVPVIIRQESADKIKLELALVENVQREDLNVVDRAQAFRRLNEEFGLGHRDIGARIGKSREYVSNSLRLLSLPSEVQASLRDGRITESHARLLLTLQSQPQEQKTLMDDIIFRGLNVRETERLTKELTAGVRKEIKNLDPETKTLEEKLAATLGARVYISKNESGGRVSIEFFSPEELRAFIERFETEPASPEGQAVLAEVRPEDLEEFTI